MPKRISIAELQHLRVPVRPHEAVAIAQELIAGDDDANAVGGLNPPFGPPTPANVYLEPNGAVSCPACNTRLAVSEVAIFLQALLPPGTPRVSGSLRYTIARALLEVNAPPFDSPEEFSQALVRHERGERAEVIRALVDRARSLSRTLCREPSPFDRRRSSLSNAQLRRQLREADARAYDQQLALQALSAMTSTRPERRSHRVAALAGGVAIGLAVIGASTVIHVGAGEATHATAAKSSANSQPPPTLAPVALKNSLDRVPDPPHAGDLPRVDEQATAAPTVHQKAKTHKAVRPAPSARVVRSERQGSNRLRHVSGRGSDVLGRLHLRWLRRKLVVRADRL